MGKEFVSSSRYRRLLADGPVFDFDLGHREVPRVAGHELRSGDVCTRCNETVSLAEGDPLPSETPPPRPGAPRLICPERKDLETIEEAVRAVHLVRAKATNNLLDVDRCCARVIARCSECVDSIADGPIAEIVDQDGRVEEDPQRSANTLRIGEALLADPLGGIIVPVVAIVGYRAAR